MNKCLKKMGYMLTGIAMAMTSFFVPRPARAASTGVEINETNFPDERFRSYIKQFDLNGDGILSPQEAKEADESFSFEEDRITSLQGIEYLTELKRLNCSWTCISELDLSKNTKLESVTCEFGCLKKLDLGNNPNLKYLSCHWNYLSELDVTNCPNLSKLYCINNYLTELDTSNNQKLKELVCDDNYLTKLDLSKNTDLTKLYCSTNELEELDVSNNPKLASLGCCENRFTEVDVSNCEVQPVDHVTTVDEAGVLHTGAKNNIISPTDFNEYLEDRSLSDADVIEEIYSVTYNGQAYTPKPHLQYGLGGLTQGVDYTVTYENNINAGTATVIITGIGRYSGTLTTTFEIRQRDISWAYMPGMAAKTYSGNAMKPAVTLKCGVDTLKKGTDYVVSYDNNTEVGTANVTITGMGNYKGTREESFDIKPISLAKASLTQVKARVYNGSAIKPAIVVKLNGVKLRQGTDYAIDYANNINVGTASYTIVGTGNYAGTIKKTFKILPKGSTVRGLTPGNASFTVSWDKQSTLMKSSRITGYQIQYSTSNDFSKNKKVNTVLGYNKTSTTIKNLSRNKVYYVRVRTMKKISGVNYFSAWSNAKMIKTK